MIAAKILADSCNPRMVRLTSFLITYPRFIHSELMTHRAFSRNAASSRAIPLRKMVEAVRAEAARPEFWTSKHTGMKAVAQVSDEDRRYCEDQWLGYADVSCDVALDMESRNLAKSICNRLLEPFAHITTLVTASQWGFSNFFALRAHPDAEPTFQALAYKMLRLYCESIPNRMGWEDWHIPYFDNTERDNTQLGGTQLFMDGKNTSEIALKIATARCARLSYLTFDGKHDSKADLRLHDDLVAAGHWSPFEHCAQAIDVDRERVGRFASYPWSNFDDLTHLRPSGWGQYRKLFIEENRLNADLGEILRAKPDWIK